MITEGKWEIRYGNCIYATGGVIQPYICEISDDHNDEETQSNLKLIAAAPDLLEACREMQSILLQIEAARALTVDERNRFIKAEQAIAKATS